MMAYLVQSWPLSLLLGRLTRLAYGPRAKRAETELRKAWRRRLRRPLRRKRKRVGARRRRRSGHGAGALARTGSWETAASTITISRSRCFSPPDAAAVSPLSPAAAPMPSPSQVRSATFLSCHRGRLFLHSIWFGQKNLFITDYPCLHHCYIEIVSL